MPRTLDVDLLRTFHAVAKLGRFKDAAVHVNRSPSAVTAQIQKLEEMVEQRLFTRNNQAVELTQFGQKLLADTTDFLSSHDRLVESLSPQMLTGKLRLGIPDAYAARFMADFLPRFAADRPLLELTVEARSSEELLQRFARGQLDITIAVLPKAPPHGELLARTHPVWVAARTFTFDRDAPLPIAVQLPGCPYRDTALTALKKHRIAHRVLLESASSPAVEACIASGLAVGLIERDRVSGNLTTHVAGIVLPDLPPHLIHVLADDGNRAALHLRDVLKSTFRIGP
ncbi:LysR substrate-binding domain-containing protein [Burkholderia sp. Ac-20353]|uniref:LysR family transcriptional regulator n=1 Tax=Burkholderia sp. Ac-20353 TaxID=2703894 RepID=UPI00197C94A9|nr:LysR substrate-binding domain-containing protein [Burkholderia sp. Ac-20353]MBN3791726.1 LysR family transcriptional regulator [Burkholderia sp. Ac-20353]